MNDLESPWPYGGGHGFDDWSELPRFWGAEDDPRARERVSQLGAWLAVVLLTAAAGAVAWLVWRGAPRFFVEYKSEAPPKWVTGISFVLLLLMAVGLYALRQSRRFMYGLVELLFGAFSLWLGTGSVLADHSKFLAVAAAVFVVIRGFDNMREGKRLFREELKRLAPPANHAATKK